MRFTKFGKAFLMSALSAGVIFGLTSCVQSYTVGFLYVTGTNSATTSGDNGIISGFKIDHNKGKLSHIAGLPISSGGSNPVRAVLLSGSRFVYVLNRGIAADGTANCGTDNVCSGSNITLFAVGGNGVLSPQGVSASTQGKNPMRMFTDSSGGYLYVLDHDSPDNYETYNAATNGCTLALGSNFQTCGDITVFKIDSDTGRLTLVVNAQVTSASGSPLPYFPVPANPVDFVLASSTVLTLSHNSTTGDTVFPYSYASTGQLTINSNSSQVLGTKAATAIVAGTSYVYVLDAESTSSTDTNGTTTTAPSGILIYSVGTGGALQLLSGGVIPGDGTLKNPLYLIVENGGKFAYVAYQGSNDTSTITQDSGIAGWEIDSSTHLLRPELTDGPWGTGSGPACILEDPSHQFVYTANFKDSTVTGRTFNVQTGDLGNLVGNANKTYSLDGPATWCIVSGRTS